MPDRLSILLLLSTLLGLPIAADPPPTGLHPIAADVAGQLAIAGTDRPFALLVELSVKPDLAERMKAAVATAKVLTRREPGNSRYELLADPANGERYLLSERWVDVAALDSHLKQPYLTVLLAELDACLAEPPKLRVMVPVTP